MLYITTRYGFHNYLSNLKRIKIIKRKFKKKKLTNREKIFFFLICVFLCKIVFFCETNNCVHILKVPRICMSDAPL